MKKFFFVSLIFIVTLFTLLGASSIPKTYKDISLPSLVAEEGEISLKSVIDREDTKYVLLDFWASWCFPCMGEVPYLVKAYDKYKSKGFEIYGCSLDESGEDWATAVKKKNMNWIHVSDLKGWKNAGAALYEVRSIPTNYLIDCSTGKIVATDLRGTNLAAKLAELLD